MGTPFEPTLLAPDLHPLGAGLTRRPVADCGFPRDRPAITTLMPAGAEGYDAVQSGGEVIAYESAGPHGTGRRGGGIAVDRRLWRLGRNNIIDPAFDDGSVFDDPARTHDPGTDDDHDDHHDHHDHDRPGLPFIW